MSLSKRYYDTLFNPGEATCWSATPYGTTVAPLEHALRYAEANFVCINPLLLSQDKEPTKPTHSALVGRRADINVTAYRNILIEMDSGGIDEQKMVLETSGAPISTLVFSGSKSLHAIISLEEPCADGAAYRRLVRRVYGKFARGSIDSSVSNPSRFTRNPGAIRDSVRQELLLVNGRVPQGTLDAWLGPEELQDSTDILQSSPGLPGILKGSTQYFLLAGAPEGGWNNSLFKAAADMARAGYDKESIISRCRLVTGYLDEKDIRTIDSAVRSTSHGRAV